MKDRTGLKLLLSIMIFILLPVILVAVILISANTIGVIGKFIRNIFDIKDISETHEYYTKFNIVLPEDSECVYVASRAEPYNLEEYLGIAEFKLNEDYDTAFFNDYEQTNKYDEEIDEFFYSLCIEFESDHYDDTFNEYLEYIKDNEGYIYHVEPYSYLLYYPDDYKLIVLFRK